MLEVKLLDSASIEALKEEGIYKDDGCYYFVYIIRHAISSPFFSPQESLRMVTIFF